MTHPTLGEMQVMPISVPSWRSRGWEVAEPKPVEPKPAGEPDQQESPRRRRSTKESE